MVNADMLLPILRNRDKGLAVVIASANYLGLTLDDIAKDFVMTRQRVVSILNRQMPEILRVRAALGEKW